jgi:hypothetical protein
MSSPSVSYDGNAIYDSLQANSSSFLLKPGQEVWPLIYATKDGQPRVVVLVATDRATPNPFFVRQVEHLAQKAGLPFRQLTFDASPPAGFTGAPGPLTFVQHTHGQTQPVTQEAWKQEMESMGVEIRGQANKPINRASSSAYHDWQRANLGNIRVVDLDLLRINPRGQLTHVIELKRSAMSMGAWQPFQADQPNFDVIAQVARKAGVGFELAFTRYNKQTLRESTNQIKVFQFENGRFQTKGIVAGRTWLTGMDLFPPAPLNLPGAVPTPGSSQVTSFQGRWKRR